MRGFVSQPEASSVATVLEAYANEKDSRVARVSYARVLQALRDLKAVYGFDVRVERGSADRIQGNQLFEEMVADAVRNIQEPADNTGSLGATQVVEFLYLLTYLRSFNEVIFSTFSRTLLAGVADLSDAQINDLSWSLLKAKPHFSTPHMRTLVKQINDYAVEHPGKFSDPDHIYHVAMVVQTYELPSLKLKQALEGRIDELIRESRDFDHVDFDALDKTWQEKDDPPLSASDSDNDDVMWKDDFMQPSSDDASEFESDSDGETEGDPQHQQQQHRRPKRGSK